MTTEHVQGAPNGGAPQDNATQAPQEQQNAPAMPEGGDPKYFNAQTGEYNWKAHAYELQFKIDQRSGQANGNPQGQPQVPVGQSVDHNKLVEDLTLAIATGGDGLKQRMALLQAGVPESMIASYADSVKVAQSARLEQAVSYAGGPEQIQAMKTWVGQNLSPQERSQLNQQLQTGNWKMAVDYVKARMGGGGKAGGTSPDVDAAAGGGGGGAAFSSQAELAQAIGKRNEKGQRLYDVDPAYRAQIAQRVRISNF